MHRWPVCGVKTDKPSFGDAQGRNACNNLSTWANGSIIFHSVTWKRGVDKPHFFPEGGLSII